MFLVCTTRKIESYQPGHCGRIRNTVFKESAIRRRFWLFIKVCLFLHWLQHNNSIFCSIPIIQPTQPTDDQKQIITDYDWKLHIATNIANTLIEAIGDRLTLVCTRKPQQVCTFTIICSPIRLALYISRPFLKSTPKYAGDSGEFFGMKFYVKLAL